MTTHPPLTHDEHKAAEAAFFWGIAEYVVVRGKVRSGQPIYHALNTDDLD